MKKYLLKVAVSAVSADGDLTTDTYKIGSYDALPEAVDAAKEDMIEEAHCFAQGRCEPDQEEYDELIKEYTANAQVRTAFNESAEFPEPGSDRIIFSHWFDNGCEREERCYSLTRLY